MQYFKHIEYADKIFTFLIISAQTNGKEWASEKRLKKILKKIDKIFCGFKNYIYLCCVETNQQTDAHPMLVGD